jgi:hypothetical protein
VTAKITSAFEKAGMREARSSRSAETISIPCAARDSAAVLFGERVMPRTFQPSERKVLATEPPCQN